MNGKKIDLMMIVIQIIMIIPTQLLFIIPYLRQTGTMAVLSLLFIGFLLLLIIPNKQLYLRIIITIFGAAAFEFIFMGVIGRWSVVIPLGLMILFAIDYRYGKETANQ